MTTTTIDYPTTDTLEDQGTRLYRNGLVRRGVSAAVATKAVAKGTPIQIRTRQIAEMVTGAFANERSLEDAQMDDTAVGDDLLRLCKILSVPILNGSGATGNVTVTCSGTVTYTEGQELTCDKNGKRYTVVTTMTVGNQGSVGVVGEDVGVATNLGPGETLKWTSPPGGSAPTCVVSITGLTNGAEPDNDARKRKRLQKRRRNSTNGQNWASLRQAAETSSASIEDAYVYPAVHGPCTQHVVVLLLGTRSNNFARACPDALVAIARAAVLDAAVDPCDTFVSTATESGTNVSVKITLPVAGGDETGWLDATNWPLPNSGNSQVKITTVTSATQFTCDASALPAAGSHFAVWNPSTKSFIHAVVLFSAGTAGAIQITMATSIGGLTTGVFISPDAANLDAYAENVLEAVGAVGPGERTAITAYQRSRRRPLIGEDNDFAGISPKMISSLADAFDEVTNAYLHAVGATVDPTKPVQVSGVTTLDTPPLVATIAQIGFYP